MNGADFAANGPFHLQLEQLSRFAWAPAASGLQRGTHWYYERARGSYADDKTRTGKVFEKENPATQKFTKTDLAKYEHAWLGLPHLVCLGAEKNFNKLAERMEEDGEPVVDLNYFQQLVAKAVLFRTAEKVFTTLGLTGYRANSVAYAVAWLAERSGRRIDLDRIWRDQKVPPGLFKALEIVCRHAHAHIEGAGGNQNERSKKADLWQEFKKRDIELPELWECEWADSPFETRTDEDDVVAAEWERVRVRFLNDNRTIEGLEAYTNRTLGSPKYRRETVAALAAHDWAALKLRPGLGAKKRRALVEMYAIAVEDLK